MPLPLSRLNFSNKVKRCQLLRQTHPAPQHQLLSQIRQRQPTLSQNPLSQALQPNQLPPPQPQHRPAPRHRLQQTNLQPLPLPNLLKLPPTHLPKRPSLLLSASFNAKGSFAAPLASRRPPNTNSSTRTIAELSIIFSPTLPILTSAAIKAFASSSRAKKASTSAGETLL